MNKRDLAGLSAQERKIISMILANEQVTIRASDVTAICHCSQGRANQILSRLNHKGWIQRLKSGVYSVVPLSSTTAEPTIEDSWALAMDIFRPAFISGWSAAEHWDLTDQIFNSVSVVTIAEQRQSDQLIGGVRFRVRVLSKDRFFGTKTVWFASKPVEIADPNRMIIDILDLPSFGGGGRHLIDIIKQFWRSKEFNPNLLLDYAIRFNRGSVFKRLGFLAERFQAPVSVEWLQFCQNSLSEGISKLDPDGPSKGKIVSKWNLRINLPL